MGKKAFLFPGQGSQIIGMGSDLLDADAFTRSLFEIASELVGEDLEKLCIHGPLRRLKQARYLQPSMVAVCLGYWKRLVAAGVQPDFVCGHSLGEITALAAAGIVSPEDCLRIATRRGELMDDVAESCSGGMLAVMFVSLEKIAQLLAEIGDPRCIVLANDNAPEQAVLSGDNLFLDRFAARITSEKLGKTRRVEVIGPWHSPFMENARQVFETWVQPFRFSEPSIPLIFNATATVEYEPARIKEIVTWQLTRPVFWRECMERLRADGVSELYEIGPQRILSGLARINGFKKGSSIFNISSLRGIERVFE